MNRFEQLFAEPNKKVVIPFLTLGDPTPAASLEIFKTIIDTGCDALEIGIPFSDPLADGPTIQAANMRALEAGMNMKKNFELLEKIRNQTTIPIGLLIPYNLIIKQGVSQAHRDLASCGVDALLVPDLPLDESSEHEASLQQYGLGAVQLVAPNTPLERAKQLIDRSTAFTYVLSVLGITGARLQLNAATIDRIKQIRQLTTKPLVVGFGISEAEHFSQVFAAGANGAIIASALIKLIEQEKRNLSNARNKVKKLLMQCIGAKSC